MEAGPRLVDLVITHPDLVSDQNESRPLLGMGLSDLEAWAEAQGQARFRGRQLHDWLYAKGARSLEAISVLPKAWREELQRVPPAGAIGRAHV